MRELIGYCGIDCAKCKAREATVFDDDELREKVADEWSALYKTEITPDMINCMGCRLNGPKFDYCENKCEIRKCGKSKKLASCGNCSEMETCEKLKPIFENDKMAKNNLLDKIPIVFGLESAIGITGGLSLGLAFGYLWGNAEGRMVLCIIVSALVGALVGGAYGMIKENRLYRKKYRG